MKERNYTLDFLKLIAMVSVVLIHTSTAFIDRSKIFSLEFDALLFINQVARFAVPVFFLVSGYLLGNKYGTIKSIPEFYKKRAKILIPYTFWIFAYYFVIFPHPISKLFSLRFVQNYITGDPSYQLYFIPTLIILYLLFPLFISYKKFFLSTKFLLALFVFETFLLSFTYYTNLDLPFYSPIRIAIYNLLPFLLGAYAGEHPEKADNIVKSGIVFFAGSMIIFGIAVNADVFIIYAAYHLQDYLRNQWRISVMLYGIASAAVLGLVFDKYLKRWNKLVLNLSLLSFGVYFVHVGILSYYLTYIDSIKFYGFISFLLCFALVTLFSFIATWIASKIPYFRALFGARIS